MKPKKIVVVGGGIVGLTTSLALLERFPGISLTLLEKEPEVGRHQTSHNSGVIHSGLYYKPGSLKAKLSLEGAQKMIAFCERHDIPLRVTGKVVVATEQEELPRLEALYERGRANGLNGLEKISLERLKEIEPHVTGLAALRVPTTGVTDFKRVAEKCSELLTHLGGAVRTGTAFLKAQRRQNEWRIDTDQDEFSADFLINCGGLHCDRIARQSGAFPPLRIIPFRGEYYELSTEAASLVKHLIYPVPDPAFPFLGVHFTRSVHDVVEAGPNAVPAFRREGYKKTDFSPRDLWDVLSYPGFLRFARRHARMGLQEMARSLSKRRFLKSLQRLIPAIQEKDLVPGSSGVRAQAVQPDGLLADDFQFLEAEGALHVLNAPSPAATASLAISRVIAEKVATML